LKPTNCASTLSALRNNLVLELYLYGFLEGSLELEIEQGYGDHDSGDQEAGDEGAVAAVPVGHVQA
jgi:hypothetical protein